MGTTGIGCAEWDKNGTWCYVDSSCDFLKHESNANPGTFWSNQVCEGVAPVFPPTSSCKCLTATEMGDMGIQLESEAGLGCANWDDDGTWCFVSDDCNLEKLPS